MNIIDSVKELTQDIQDNPYLGQYIKEGLLNKIPFVNRDTEEEKAYLQTRAKYLGELKNRDDAVRLLSTMYDEGDSVNYLLKEFSGLQPESTTPVNTSKLSDQYTNTTPTKSGTNILGTAISSIPQSISDYATSYSYSPMGEYGQSRLTDENLGILWTAINDNYPDLDMRAKETLLANLVAVAQAESGMGGAYGNPDAANYKDTNYWNWFAGGDRNFDPETFAEMADIITKGIGNYILGTGGKFTRDNASTYTGNDNLSYWYDSIYQPAMSAMGY